MLLQNVAKNYQHELRNSPDKRGRRQFKPLNREKMTLS
jgi:hypothetical protein